MVEISSLFLGLFGIVVTIITFIFSYNKTIGARNERAKTANNDIIKILKRNLIMERRVPKFEEINRLISSKIIEYKVRERD